jgi:dihydroflavonol-4-reductase
MNSEISAQRFILSAENLSYKQIFYAIAKYFEKKPPQKKVTSFMAEIVWRFESIKARITGEKHLLTKETARTAQASVYFDNNKILNALPGFNFLSIDASLSNTCAALKEKYHLK